MALAGDPRPNHLGQGVVNQVGVTGVVEGLSEGWGQADPLIELADGQQAGNAGAFGVRGLRDDGPFEEIRAFLPGRRYTQRCSPSNREGSSLPQAGRVPAR